MHRGVLAMAVLAVVAFVGALVALRRTPAPEPSAPVPARPTSPASSAARSGSSPSPRGVSPRPRPKPTGLQLGKGSSPTARSDAQTIVDDALAELRRLDDRHRDTAREVYMNAHSAVERIEDELADDDEPGRAKLRADSEALRDELRRIYGEGVTARP